MPKSHQVSYRDFWHGKINHALYRLPDKWRAPFSAEWQALRPSPAASDLPKLHQDMQRYIEHADNCVLPLDATDADLNDHAAKLARRAREIISLPVLPASQRDSLKSLCFNNKIAPPYFAHTDAGAVQRMLDPHWWRRCLRRVQAKDIEAAHIALGFVHAKGEKYVSNESLQRRAQQCRRNRKMLEQTFVVNEDGEIFSLAQLSDKSVANPKLRRGELMLRIRGMEEVAKARGDACLFVTMTCPSRFHRKQFSGEDNGKFSGATPSDAQRYLCTVWSRIRSALHRAGIFICGFRVAEPHHDACPHWHLLLFTSPARIDALRSVIQRYALADSGSEEGAATYRCRLDTIDLAKISAAGYVAKYIAKAVGFDAEQGADVAQSPKKKNQGRVPAWSATHGIRQFQQIGGAPVGLWRELRKIPYQTLGRRPPKALRDSWQAANRTDKEKCDFGAFIAATGGVAISRKERKLHIAKEFEARQGKYGEPIGDVPVGIRHARTGAVYLSARRHWQIVAPRCSVNNCTRSTAQKIGNKIGHNTVEGSKLLKPPWNLHHATSYPVPNPQI